MSNHLAIATVTMTLQQILQHAVRDISGTSVRTGRPDGNHPPGVNLYLYHVAWNAAFRNADVPTRDAQSRLQNKPAAPLDLYYPSLVPKSTWSRSSCWLFR